MNKPAGQEQEAVKEQKPLTDGQKAAYSIGFLKGREAGALFEMDMDLAISGFTAGMKGETPLFEEGEIQATLATLQKRLQENQKNEINSIAEKNKQVALDFLKENGQHADIVTTSSGVQYRILHKSDKKQKPKLTDQVKVHYELTLPASFTEELKGRLIDSSVKRGEPAVFGLGQVIPGWSEIVQLMSVGEKWECFIPPALGYGVAGNQGIPPNQLLRFEIELLEIIKG